MKRSYLKRIGTKHEQRYYAGNNIHGIPQFLPLGSPRIQAVSPRQAKAILADIPLHQARGYKFQIVPATAPRQPVIPA